MMHDARKGWEGAAWQKSTIYITEGMERGLGPARGAGTPSKLSHTHTCRVASAAASSTARIRMVCPPAMQASGWFVPTRPGRILSQRHTRPDHAMLWCRGGLACAVVGWPVLWCAVLCYGQGAPRHTPVSTKSPGMSLFKTSCQDTVDANTTDGTGMAQAWHRHHAGHLKDGLQMVEQAHCGQRVACEGAVG